MSEKNTRTIDVKLAEALLKLLKDQGVIEQLSAKDIAASRDKLMDVMGAMTNVMARTCTAYLVNLSSKTPDPIEVADEADELVELVSENFDRMLTWHLGDVVQQLIEDFSDDNTSH